MEVVKQYYDAAAEGEYQRLNTVYTQVEYKSTLYLVDKYFPKEGKILDIGSGPGRYSLALLRKGYEVSLLDLSQNELDIAKRKITEEGYIAQDYYCQSALDLECFEDNTFDALLVMGPLYHLHTEEERVKVLTESRRILKKDGVAIIAYINTWGALKASLREFPDCFTDLAHFDRYQEGNLKFSHEESFTATYFTTPPIALKEVEAAGYNLISYAGAESFVSGLNIQLQNLAAYMPETYNNYVTKAVEYCEYPQYRDATEHLHIVVRK